MTWLIPRDELTSDQLRAIEADVKEHRLVFGAAGSGKTQVLLHRAHYLDETLDPADDRFHIFVYTNVLKHYIQSALELLKLPENCVSTFDAWCADYYQQKINNRLPWNQQYKQPDFTRIRNDVLNSLSTMTKDLPLFDFVMVDEGQDLDAVTFQILKRIARHLSVSVDHCQQIYEQGSTKDDIIQVLGISTKNTTLIESYRCCPYIIQLAAEFIEDKAERIQFINRSRTEQTERETPMLYIAKDFDDELARLVDVVRTRQAKGERIAILFPQNKKVYGFATALREAGLEVETPKREKMTGKFYELDFNSDLPKLMTYHSIKGLTFDTVIMPRLVGNSFYNIQSERRNRLLFVGITRATKWVYLSTIENSEMEELKPLTDKNSCEFLAIQNGSDLGSGNIHPKEKSDDDLLDIL